MSVVKTRSGRCGVTISRCDDFVLVFGKILFSNFQNTQGLIFVVDSNDRERIEESREELTKMVGAIDRKFRC